MKNLKPIIYPHFCFCITMLLTPVLSIGQQASKKELKAITLQEVIRFEGITLGGDRIFGIYPSREKAMKIVKDYMTRNATNKYQLTYKTIYSGNLEVSQGEQVFKRFAHLCPKGYKVISKEEYNAMLIMDTDELSAAAWYYMKSKKLKPKEAEAHVSQLVTNYRKYLKD